MTPWLRTLPSLLCLLAALAPRAAAHEIRPALLQIVELETDTYDILWKVPARGDLRLGIYIGLPEEATPAGDPVGRLAGDAFVERQRITCPGGLDGKTIRVLGLEATRVDVLARVVHLGGATQTARILPGHPEFVVAAEPSWTGIAASYAVIGVEHILFGIDHLLFLLALLFLVTGWRRLLATVTAFTLAHSVTLSVAALGWVEIPGPPVEACIALSVVFVASEVLKRRAGEERLSERRPWLVAFAFGLLHGLGFAGALSEVGLPEHAIPLALLFFNVGVELGQLLFIALVVSLLSVARRVVRVDPTPALGVASAYAVGCLAVYWTLERLSGF